MTTVLRTTSALPEAKQEAVIVEKNHEAMMHQAIKNVAGVQAFLKNKKKQRIAGKKRSLEVTRLAYNLEEMLTIAPAAIPSISLPSDMLADAPGWASACIKNVH